MGRLVHARMAQLPGYVGQSADKMPAKHHGEAKHDEFLMALGIVFPEIANDLKYGLCQFTEFQMHVHRVNAEINDRKDHAIEGYEEDKLVANEFTFNPHAAEPEWQPMAALDQLPPDKRAAVDAMLTSDLRCIRKRLLSPAEVIAPALPKLKKLPYCALPEIVGRDLGMKKMVERKQFDIAGKFYLAEVRDKAGYPKQLDNGEVYLVFLNPFARDRLIVCDAKTMAYVGECKPWNIPARADADAIHAATGARERLFKDAVAEATVRQGLGQGREPRRQCPRDPRRGKADFAKPPWPGPGSHRAAQSRGGECRRRLG